MDATFATLLDQEITIWETITNLLRALMKTASVNEGHETSLKPVTPIMSQMMSEKRSKEDGGAQKFPKKMEMVYIGAW